MIRSIEQIMLYLSSEQDATLVFMHDRAVSSDHPGEFAAAIRDRRKLLGLRQDELAAMAGVSTRFVHTLERGKQTVRLDVTRAVLDVLGMQLHAVGPGVDVAVG
jgi:y4mF family transcriptional regulator